jgi:hypothetical protein
MVIDEQPEGMEQIVGLIDARDVRALVFLYYYAATLAAIALRMSASAIMRSEPQTADDPDTAAYSRLPCCVLPETPPTWSRLQTQHGFPKPCEKHKAYDLQVQAL